MIELKTLKDLETTSIECVSGCFDEVKSPIVEANKLRQNAIKIFKNLQGPKSIYPIILENFPDSSKGEIAKDKWNETYFRYGAEYGMLAMLFHIFNITEEDIE